jgi:hypothetical protein
LGLIRINQNVVSFSGPFSSSMHSHREYLRMKVIEQTATRLVIEDNQADKRIGLILAGIFLTITAVIFAFEGGWQIAGLLLVLAIGLVIYSRHATSIIRILMDKQSDVIALTTSDNNSSLDFQRALSDIEHAETHHHYQGRKDAGDSPLKCPRLLFKDGEYRLLRVYHSAGTQSDETVALINNFLAGNP